MKSFEFFYEYTEVKTIMVHEFQGELFKNTVRWYNDFWNKTFISNAAL